MAPSKLAIATSSVVRLLKEEASYHKEMEQQEARIAKADPATSTDQNAEYILKQERKALEETKAVLPQLRDRITQATENLEKELTAAEGSASEEEVAKAKDAISQAKPSK